MILRSYKEMIKQKMSGSDYKDYSEFLIYIKGGWTDKDLTILYKLHAKYFHHRFNIPCGCGGAKRVDEIAKWMKDVNKVHDNGI